MRTTVDIDKDVLDGMKRVSDKEGIPFRTLLNRLLRDSLKRPFVRQKPYVCPTFDLGNDLPPKMLAIMDELADQELVRKMYGEPGR